MRFNGCMIRYNQIVILGDYILPSQVTNAVSANIKHSRYFQ